MREDEKDEQNKSSEAFQRLIFFTLQSPVSFPIIFVHLIKGNFRFYLETCRSDLQIKSTLIVFSTGWCSFYLPLLYVRRRSM